MIILITILLMIATLGLLIAYLVIKKHKEKYTPIEKRLLQISLPKSERQKPRPEQKGGQNPWCSSLFNVPHILVPPDLVTCQLIKPTIKSCNWQGVY